MSRSRQSLNTTRHGLRPSKETMIHDTNFSRRVSTKIPEAALRMQVPTHSYRDAIELPFADENEVFDQETSSTKFSRQALQAVDSIVNSTQNGRSIEATEYEARLLRSRRQLEELKMLRTTEAEAALSAAEKTWKARIHAQQSVIEHLRQEIEDLKRQLATSESSRSVSVDEEQILQSDVYRELKSELTKQRAINHDSHILKDMLGFYEDMTALRVHYSGDFKFEVCTASASGQGKLAIGYFARYFVLCTSINAEVVFTIEKNFNTQEFEYCPVRGTGNLPKYLQDDIVFGIDQGPNFLKNLLSHLRDI